MRLGLRGFRPGGIQAEQAVPEVYGLLIHKGQSRKSGAEGTPGIGDAHTARQRHRDIAELAAR